MAKLDGTIKLSVETEDLEQLKKLLSRITGASIAAENAIDSYINYKKRKDNKGENNGE